MPEWGRSPFKRYPMNVTARVSLIALIAIVGACWAIPVLLVSVVPSDAGMIAMMALIYLVLPATAITLGLLAANSARTLFWIPAALGIGFALLLPLAIEVAGTSRSMASPMPRSAMPPLACASGWPLGSIAKPSPRKPPQARSPQGDGTHRSNNHAGKPRAKQFLQRPASLAAYDVQQIR